MREREGNSRQLYSVGANIIHRMTGKKASGACARGICVRHDRVEEANIGGSVRGGSGGYKKIKKARRTHPARDRGDPEK